VAVDHFGQLPLPQVDELEGVEGYISYKDKEKPQREIVTIPVDSFAQLRGYMNWLQSQPERYTNINWRPTSKALKPFMEK
jgi:hypothetical protein